MNKTVWRWVMFVLRLVSYGRKMLLLLKIWTEMNRHQKMLLSICKKHTNLSLRFEICGWIFIVCPNFQIINKSETKIVQVMKILLSMTGISSGTWFQFLDVPQRADFLEKAKDVFLSWYSTRIVLAIQSETPVDDLLSIKQKYEMLRRTAGFLVVFHRNLEQ